MLLSISFLGENASSYHTRHVSHYVSSNHSLIRVLVKRTHEDLSPEFQSALEAIRNAPNKRAEFEKFKQKFGTHFVKEIVIGGSMIRHSKDDSSHSEKAHSKGGSVATGFLAGQMASGPMAGIGGGVESSIAASTEQKGNHVEIRGFTGDDNDNSEWRQRREQREYA
jgi:hypothetical protein